MNSSNHVPRPSPDLREAVARFLFTLEYPGKRQDEIWDANRHLHFYWLSEADRVLTPRVEGVREEPPGTGAAARVALSQLRELGQEICPDYCKSDTVGGMVHCSWCKQITSAMDTLRDSLAATPPAPTESRP